QITARSTGTGDAGAITLSAATLKMNDGAAISTEAASANGGNIALHVGELMFLTDSQVTTSVKGAFGNGGNILIDPQFLILQHSDIIAQAVAGHGGDITIVADDFFPSADSIVSASSQLGLSGTVDIVGPRVDLNGSLVVLASELRSAAEVLRTSCAARGAQLRSSLTEGGRGGLPQDPETTIPALYLAGRDPAALTPRGSGAALPIAAPAPLASPSALRVAMHCGA
ncbi:MAG TPA: hypothetical protein VKQ73_13790, partial [Stellaceae bacterium]|nr:hypothetical protein [Stellaceae bacterium]